MIQFYKAMVVDDSQIRSGPGDHGKAIGYVYEMGHVIVEIPNLPTVPVEVKRLWFHDGWVRISDPKTWKETGKAGWIEFAALRPVSPATGAGRRTFVVEIGGDEAPSIKEL